MASFTFRPGVIRRVALLAPVAAMAIPSARADNKRLNESVLSGPYTIPHQAGCTNDVVNNSSLTLAAQ